MLGKIPIVIEAGPVQQRYIRGSEGRARVRLSKGDLVSMRHWSKTRITLSGSGWLNPGLDGLDYDDALELRCTNPQVVSSAGTTLTLISQPRPDQAPWADALVGDIWYRTPVSLDGLTATVEPYPGASLYRVSWMPVFMVKTDPPETGMDNAAGGVHDWTMTLEEA